MTPKPRVLIFVVSYNHEHFLNAVLERIPRSIRESRDFDLEILVIDDQSTDNTFAVAREYARLSPRTRVTVLYNPVNQGYGGNQKIGYRYAVKEGFDVVVLLHGDGQYPPEELENMILPILRDECDVVLGSRMVDRLAALRGGMPLYKWFGNVFLTGIQNRILRVKLKEFHTGYRSYRVSALRLLPFEWNSDDFDFDTDILIQLIDTGRRIREMAIPTFYGDEISRVKVIRYGFQILGSTLNSRLMKLGIFYHPKFDYAGDSAQYALKLGYASPHQFALDRVAAGERVLDIGRGPGGLAAVLSRKGAQTISVYDRLDPETRDHSVQSIQSSPEAVDYSALPDVDTVLLLDVLEHLRSPEKLLQALRERYCGTRPEIVVSTGNVAFLPLRMMLFTGHFNYGRRGILDLDHTRLFTFRSLRRVLVSQGFDIVEERGMPAPFPLAVGEGRLARFLLRLNRLAIAISKGLFAYQIVFVVQPRPTLELLLQRAQVAGALKVGQEHEAQHA